MIQESEEYSRLMVIYESLDVRRWHREKIPAQTTCDHSGKMVLLCLALHPNPSAALLSAIMLHDIEEWLTGDIPPDTKAQFEGFAEFEQNAREEYFEVSGIPNPFIKLTEVDKLWISYLDKLEVLAYIDSNLGREHIHAADIFERQSLAVDKIGRQLKALGYLNEPEATSH